MTEFLAALDDFVRQNHDCIHIARCIDFISKCDIRILSTMIHLNRRLERVSTRVAIKHVSR